jgi:hypothetical protein
MFKLGMALVFAVIAALVVFLTGLFGDARLSTATLRSLVGFLCAGAFTYLVTFILEAKGWAAFDKMPEQRMSDMQSVLYNADDIDFDTDGAADGAPQDFAEPVTFKPLAEEELVHMRTPEEADADTGEPMPAPA